MTREIKFRVWDKKEKRMFKPKSLIWTYVFLIEEEGRSQRYGSGEVELMQYTGLKDKNGKEIYEGDIVDGRRYYRPKLYGKRIVKWDFYDLHDLENWCSRKEVEVIGNVWENPEILENNMDKLF